MSFEDVSMGLNIPYRDKMAHFIFHAVGALLGCHFLRERSRGQIRLSRAVIIILVSLFLYGIIIEVLQIAVTTTRSGEVTDVLANIAGALAGTVAVKLLYGGRWQLKW